MDEPIEIEKDHPVKLLMDEYAKRMKAMPGVSYCMIVDVGQERGATKAEVLETIRKQLSVLDDG